jgi:hypothetical protein
VVDDDAKPLRPNIQLNVINIGVKIGLISLLLFHKSNYMSFGFYHFISLYAATCFLILCFFEYHRKNFILALLAFIGFLAYQPVYSALKYDVLDDDVRTNDIVIPITAAIIIPWIVFDVIRWIIDNRKFKKQSV